MRLRLPAIGMAIALLAAACGTAAPASPSAPPASAGASTAPSTAPSASPAGESVLRVARLADHYNFWHPVEFQTGNQFQWWSSVFNTLVEAEADSKTVIGDLAETFDVSPDAATYTFHLVDERDVARRRGLQRRRRHVHDQLDRPELRRLQGLPARLEPDQGRRHGRRHDEHAGRAQEDRRLDRRDHACRTERRVPLQHHRHGQRHPAGAHPQGRDQGRRREDRLHARHARRHDRHRTVQAHQLHGRPVGRAGRQPRLLQGRPEDQQGDLQALRRPGPRRGPARVGRSRPGLPSLAGRVRPARCDRHAQRDLGREPGHHPDRVPDQDATLGQEEFDKPSTTPSTARRSSTTSTRAGRRSFTTRPGSPSTTT